MYTALIFEFKQISCRPKKNTNRTTVLSKLCHSQSAYVPDVSIDVPQELDITCLRGTGLQPGEEELPESGAQPGIALLNLAWVR